MAVEIVMPAEIPAVQRYRMLLGAAEQMILDARGLAEELAHGDGPPGTPTPAMFLTEVLLTAFAAERRSQEAIAAGGDRQYPLRDLFVLVVGWVQKQPIDPSGTTVAEASKSGNN